MPEPEPRHQIIGRIEDEDAFLRVTLSQNIHGEMQVVLTLGDIDGRRRDHILAVKQDQFAELEALIGTVQTAIR